MKMRDILDLVESHVLLEGRDAPLFHFTTDHSLFRKILHEDVLRQGKRGGVSLTRDLKTPFYGDRWDREALLILDQTRLAHRYKIVPMYGDSVEAMQKAFERDPDAEIVPPQDESEERVMADIAPLHKYLRAIALPGEAIKHPVDLQYVQAVTHDTLMVNAMLLADYCRKFRIPVVARESVRQNGTWSQDYTKMVLQNGKKISAMYEKGLRTKPSDPWSATSPVERPHA